MPLLPPPAPRTGAPLSQWGLPGHGCSSAWMLAAPLCSLAGHVGSHKSLMAHTYMCTLPNILRVQVCTTQSVHTCTHMCLRAGADTHTSQVHLACCACTCAVHVRMPPSLTGHLGPDLGTSGACSSPGWKVPSCPAGRLGEGGRAWEGRARAGCHLSGEGQGRQADCGGCRGTADHLSSEP